MPAAEASPGPAPLLPPGEGRRAPFLRQFARLAPYAVPPLYLLAALLAQPPDQFGLDFENLPNETRGTHPELFDDHDFVALALRGYNASLGRQAGRIVEPTWEDYDEDFVKQMRQDRPLAERYYLEYPHAALLIFRLGFVWQGDLPPAPAAFCDSHYMNIVEHRPTPEERPLWVSFRRAARTYSCLMAACLLLLIAVLQRGYLPDGSLSASGLLVVLPAALYFSLFRFDVVPALLMAVGLACLGRRWWAASAVFLASAAMVKVYPVLLVPLVLRHLGLTSRRALLWLAVYALTVGLFLIAPLAHDGWEGTWGPYRVQLTRELVSHDLTVYGYLLPTCLADNTPLGRAFRSGTLLLTIAILFCLRPGDLASLLRRGAVVLIVFVSLAVFYSPQWVLWLVPLLVPLTRRSLLLTALVVALDLVSYYSFVWVGQVEPMLYLRIVVLASLGIVLLAPEWRARHRRGSSCDAGSLCASA